ncbi:MAG: DUF4215 domain-containing protein [Myxococcota bacterium]
MVLCLLQEHESCDANDEDGDGCRTDCTLEVCGDGIVDPGEQCDDGNTNDFDSCKRQLPLHPRPSRPRSGLPRRAKLAKVARHADGAGERDRDCIRVRG